MTNTSHAQASALPTRVTGVDEARRMHGDFVDRLLPALVRGDPLADAFAEDMAEIGHKRARVIVDTALRDGICATPNAPASLVALFEALDHVPVWVNWPAIARAEAVFFRSGALGGVVLGAKSLITGYCSPGGNKPLVLTGQLNRPERLGQRLAETGRFVTSVCHASSEHGGMRRFGAGFAATVHVRLMHAAVRRLLRISPKYDASKWGEAINQHDMAGTTLLFSLAFIEGLRTFGMHIHEREAHDYMQLWRYNGYVMGVEPQLLCATVAEGHRMADVIACTQGPPDDDARTLVRALIESPRHAATRGLLSMRDAQRRVALGYGFTRSLLGQPMADALALPRTWARHVVPSFARVFAPIDRIGRTRTQYNARLVAAGRRYWARSIAQQQSAAALAFAAPEKLARP